MPEEPITLRQFNRMEPGMTYAEVVLLLGREGQLRWRAEGLDGPVVAKYFWSNADESYAEAAFEDSRLAYKHQFGLGAGGAAELPGAWSGGRKVRPSAVPAADFQRLLARGMAAGGTLLVAAVALLSGEAPEATGVDLLVAPVLLLSILIPLPRHADRFRIKASACGVVFFVVMLALTGLSPAAGGFAWWLICLLFCWLMARMEVRAGLRWVAGGFAVVSCGGSILALA